MEHKCEKTDLKGVEKCELNREEIIKALECCEQDAKNCPSCPLARDYSPCSKTMARNALSLIKELAERVENYRQELGEVRVALAEANNDKKKLTEENERLRAEKEAIEIFNKDYKSKNEILKEQLDDKCDRCIERERADTVKKMQERLNKAFNFGHTILEKSICDIINQIAKEILEGG